MMSANIATSATQYVVQSYTDAVLKYTVTEGASVGRPWMCDCKAWIFARIDRGTGFKKDCKHIRAVQAASQKAKTATKSPFIAAGLVDVEVGGEKMKVGRPEPKTI